MIPAAAGQSRLPAVTTPHDKTFWLDVATKKFAVPAGTPLPELVAELSGYLGVADPDLRDDIAYSTLTNWIYRQRIVPVELRRTLLAQWTGNLTIGIGDTGTETVLRRSFSALSLGVLVALDNEAAYLEKADFDRLLTAALSYFIAERDVRGFDEKYGWVHSVAHTADLLKFLARSRHLEVRQQAQILDAIARKLTDVTTPLVNGEDERIARAVLSLVARPDFDAAAFKTWAVAVAKTSTLAPTPALLAEEQNKKHVLVSLFAVLSADTRTLATIEPARTTLIGVLKGDIK